MATEDYAGLHELTVSQQNAIDLLVTGATDTATAEAVGVHRVTVTRWRHHHPGFKAELNKRRAEVWQSAQEKFRGLVGKATDAISAELDGGINAWKAGIEVLKLARVESNPAFGPIEAEDVIAEMVDARLKAKQAERKRLSSMEDELAAQMMSSQQRRTEYEADRAEATEEVMAELAAKLSSDDCEGDCSTADHPAHEEA